ncbi:MAG: type II toxin-antitoxin system RelE/ParE family toxin [Nitrospinales bacterium]
MLKSFKCRETEKLFNRAFSRKLPQNLQKLAVRKLWMLHAATDLKALSVPPSNCLERLRGDRMGQYSIRINLQWRICFEWRAGDAHNVEIVDYH